MVQEIINSIQNKEAVIGVIGVGYVGIPLILRFSEVGFPVIGIDIDPDKVSKLNDGISYISHISSERISEARNNGFFATTNFSAASNCDALIICVPTPLNKYREPDLQFVFNTIESIGPFLKKGQIIALESTTYPGTTDEELKPRIESKGFKVGEDIFLVYSPEREDPGNKNFATKSIPKICGGCTPNCLEIGKALYSEVIDQVVTVSSTKAAEMTKLLENIHRAINIGLVNEMKVLADRMKFDIYEVIDAAATKPFGFTAYYPGPGLGGHCIPIDPFYLTWKAREYGLHTRFIELAGEINSSMPDFVVSKTIEALNDRGKSVRHAKILVLGIAYKKNIDDMRESPSVFIMEKLRDRGAVVSYCDPHVPKFPKMREHHFDLESLDLNPEILAAHDAVIIATDHDIFDRQMIESFAQLIIDTRGTYRQPRANLVKA